MHTVRRLSAVSLLAFAALLASACAPKSASDLGHKLVVHGVVTDAALLTPLQGVTVKLLSSDNYPAVNTDARGYFQFTNVQQTDNLLVQYTFAGYQTVTVPVNPTVLLPDAGLAAGDGGIPNFPGFGENVDGFDASIALTQLVLVPVNGLVYDNVTPASGAQVLLATLDGTIGYQAKTGADGRFAFAGVRPGTWVLMVLPFDRDGDGQSDTQFYSQVYTIDVSTSTTLGNVVVVLQDVQQALVASSFTNLGFNEVSYPIRLSDMAANLSLNGTVSGGISVVLPAPGTKLFLHFGAEVDPTLTAFELVGVELSRFSTVRYTQPIPLAVTWDHGEIATLTASSTLSGSADGSVGYQLRIRALRWKDGTIGITESPTSFAAINFTVQALPTLLTSVQPSVYIASKFTPTQAATQAVFDSSTVWLLDGNGDFVYDAIAATNLNSGTGLQLTWTHVPGAVSYRVLARNTTSAGNGATAFLDWEQIATTAAPDPTVTTQVIAQVNPWSPDTGRALGYGGAPWAFGNHVQFTVLSQDALGFTSPIDTTKVLDTADTFGGLITSIDVDSGAVYPSQQERGTSFTKAVHVTFSEPMNSSSSTPTITSGNTNLTVVKVLASTWGNGNAPGVALNGANAAFENLQLSVKGACSEVTVVRSAGDTLVPVRDTANFLSGARVLFLASSAPPAYIGEATIAGTAGVDTVNKLLTLSTGMATSTPQGSLVCALSGATEAIFTAQGTGTINVSDATPFFVGEMVAIYEPQLNATPPVYDVRTVQGVDTVAKLLLLSGGPLQAGHTPNTSVVVPLNGGNFGSQEVQLRGAVQMDLAKDASGARAVDLFVAGPYGEVMVGDQLLVDADGDLKTTNDQQVVTINQVKFAPTTTPAAFSVVVDLQSVLLIHGKSKVIALGDSFKVTGTKDSSGNNKPLDTHRDQFTADGAVLY
jgi:Carboxypeptidase regulatory-like domain